VALLTGPTLAPAAARFAVDLRMARRAWLVGEPVTTAVAESRWMPIGTKGLAVRTEQLEDALGVVPDVLPADLSLPLPTGDEALATAGLKQGLWSLALLGQPAPVDRTLPVQRPALLPREPQREPFPPPATSSGIIRADLLILHGAIQLFFPYVHRVGNGIDARLMETLAAVDAQPVTDPTRLMHILDRFTEVLEDGHASSVALARPPPAGYFPVSLEQVAGEPVIRRSAVPGIHPGDTLISVAGRPMAKWLAEVKARTSAATPGHLTRLAMLQLQELNEPTVFGLRGVDGSTRTVEVQPQPYSAMPAVAGPASRRPSGSLADLGAPTLHYINLDASVLGGIPGFLQALTAAEGATGLVLDMRGYPSGNHYQMAQRLIPHPFTSPLFRIPFRAGPDRFDRVERFSNLEPLSSPSYAGPIALLMGPESVSAAENFSMMLTSAERVTVIGRQSAGTNGNITGLALPGAVMSNFTGMEVLFSDRTPFHGVGIVPHLQVEPTAEDLAAGRDAELLRAIQFLSTGQ
jgi:C-terminal processing protease CtpA/Prc